MSKRLTSLTNTNDAKKQKSIELIRTMTSSFKPFYDNVNNTDKKSSENYTILDALSNVSNVPIGDQSIQSNKPAESSSANFVKQPTPSSNIMLHLTHSLKKNKLVIQQSDEKKCNYDEICMHDCILITKDGKLHVNKHIMSTFCPVLWELFKQDINLFEIDMTEFKSVDVKEWLCRWHPVPGFVLDMHIPTKNIGIYMQLCSKYGMIEMLEFAILSLADLDPLENLDLVTIVNKSILNETYLFKYNYVYSILSEWLITIPKKIIETLSPIFLHKCLIIIKKKYYYKKSNYQKSIVDCTECKVCTIHTEVKCCTCYQCKKL
jgi:hypothetical protein